MLRLSCGIAVVLGSVCSCQGQQELPYELKQVTVRDGIELAYIEAGAGTPVVFIHGTLGDLFMWTDYVREFSKDYRAIAYSRRYNYPNENAAQKDHSTAVEGEDLTAFIKELELPPVHIVGFSYGGYTALHLAVDHPELVRTLTLAEPPLIPWIEDLRGPREEEAKTLVSQIYNEFRIPARQAIAEGKIDEAVEIFIDHAIRKGAYSQLERSAKESIDRNVPEFVAEVTSASMFAPLTRRQVRTITAPTLMLSGAHTTPSLRMTDDELEKALPSKLCKRVVIPDATHAMWHEQPERCKKAVREFLSDK